MVERVLPLAKEAKPGRFGALNGEPGVTLSVRHPLSMVTIIARKDEAIPELTGCTLRWAGAGQYYAISASHAEGALYRELKVKLAGLAALSDQSHGRVMLRIEGPRARAVLAKGTAVDLHTDEFPVGKSAVTQMAHIGVHLTRTGEDSFELSVFRGFSENFWDWLTGQAEEFGYLVVRS